MAEETYPCRLYLVSPPKFVLSDFASQLEEALGAGDVGAFQLRLKDVPDSEIIAATEKLLPIAHAAKVAFILNDRVDLARQLGVDGVHLGQEDTKVEEARERLGDAMVIGTSCHDSRHLAMEAGEAGADYVAFGAFFATQSKSPEKLAKYGVPTSDILDWWATHTTVPSVAIGGITPGNCVPLVTAGADFVAAITAVWKHEQGPGKAVAAFNKAIRDGLKARAPHAA
jgi:thiamine-phosphate pyrophosphorylase